MSRTWQTDEAIRQLADADLDELVEVIEGTDDGAPEALADWIREGNAPKSLYDAWITLQIKVLLRCSYQRLVSHADK